MAESDNFSAITASAARLDVPGKLAKGIVMNFSGKMTRASLFGLGLLLTGALQADTVYDMTFTDLTKNPTFSSPTGTLTINGADQITSFNVSFDVLQPYNYEGAHGSPGDVLTFNTASLGGATVTYNPATGYFGSSYNYSFAPVESSAADPNNEAFIDISGGYSALGDTYYFDAYYENEFSSRIDSGHWTVAAAPVSTPIANMPEPATTGLLLSGLLLGGALLRRRRPA